MYGRTITIAIIQFEIVTPFDRSQYTTSNAQRMEMFVVNGK